MLPNRLSYKEMYRNKFKYPSIWTEENNYKEYKDLLLNKIDDIIKNYYKYIKGIESDIMFLQNNFCIFQNIKKELLNEQ